MQLKVKQDFSVNGTFYLAGDTIEEKLPLSIVNKLNEKGYIEPLSIKDMMEYDKEFNKPKKDKEVK